MRIERLFVIALWAVGLSLCSAVHALNNEPRGFDKADFGMSVAEVRKLYPEMTELDPSKVESIYAREGMANYTLSNVSVEGFKEPANLLLRFNSDRLWMVRVNLSANDTDSMVDVITKHHGPPTWGTVLAGWVWPKTMVVTSPGSRYYEIMNRELSAQTVPEFFKQGHAHEGEEAHPQ